MTSILTPVRNLWLERLTSPARLRLYVWLSLATQILIVVTGGLVRLTGSGLGCPTWPKCTEESLVSTSEMGIHGVIEFGNRLLTFVLLVVALLTFATIIRRLADRALLLRIVYAFFGFVALFVVGLALAVSSLDTLSLSVLAAAAIGALATAGGFAVVARRKDPRGLVLPSFGLGFGIILQAVVGGVTVLTELNSWIVGLHFLISSVLIALASLMVFRALPKGSQVVSGASKALAIPTVLAGAVSIVVGVLVTGAGPHAGDALTPRNGLDLEVWQHYHSYPGYLMLGLIALQLFFQTRGACFSMSNLATRALTLLFAASIAQALIGVAQARLGVPEFLVALHMLGAAVLCSLLTFQFLVLARRA
ncbi:MAG: COX15/CtaA family protein [Aquiluna sp.]